METRTKVKEVKVIETVFVASDGTEFESESEAKKYELSLRDSIIKSYGEWKPAYSLVDPFDDYIGDDHEIILIRLNTPASKNKFKLLLSCMDMSGWVEAKVKAMNAILKKKDVTAILFKCKSTEEVWVSWDTLEDRIERLKNSLKPKQ